LVGKLKDLYLLTDAGLGKTGLAHDSIAPLIQDMMRTSDNSGQRAFRILRNKLPNYLLSSESIIDADDLELVEEGVGGMRLWTLKEEELIEASREKRDADRRRMLFFKRLGMAAILLIIGLSIFAGREAIKAKQQADRAEKQTLIAEAEADRAEKQTLIAEAEEAKAKQQEQIAKEEEAKARAERANAFRQKRFAELSEKKAVEQKGIAEAEKERAEEQTELAKEQTELAKEQRARAVAGEKDATEQRGIAEKKTIEVQRKLDLERSKSDADKAEDLARLDDYEGALSIANESIKAFLASSGGDIKNVNIPSEVYNSLNSVYESVSNSLGNNVFVAHPDMARDLEFNAATDRIAFSTFTDKKTGQIYLVNNEANGSQDRQILSVDDEVRTIRFSPDGKLLLAGTVDGRVLGWEYSNKDKRYKETELFEDGQPLAPKNPSNQYTSENRILSIAFAMPDKNASSYYLAICTKKSYYICKVDKYGRFLDEIQQENRLINYCMFSKTGKYFTLTTQFGAEIYTKKGGAKKWTLYKKIPLMNATEASFSSDDGMIAVGNTKGFVILYDLKNNKTIFKRSIHKAALTALKFSPDNDKLITSSLDHTVKLFDIARYKKDNTQVEPITLLGSSTWIWDISFSKDEKYIYAISQDQTIRKWPTDIEELFKNIEKAKNEKLYLRSRRGNSN
jgi:lipopolysaccharide export system protein LptA